MKQKIKIDIVSDVVCPWCIVGYRKLQIALAELTDKVEAEIEWHPFELNPDMPAEGEHLREHIMRKYGSSAEQSDAARDNLTAVGLDLNFQFNFFDGMRIVNTFKAHQLLHWAKSQNKQIELKLAFFDAYFTDKIDVSDQNSLLDIIEKIGLDKVAAMKVLNDETCAEDVRAKQQHWRAHGIQGVPAVILDNKYLISGAQDPAHFKQALEQLCAEKEAT